MLYMSKQIINHRMSRRKHLYYLYEKYINTIIEILDPIKLCKFRVNSTEFILFLMAKFCG